MKLKYITHPDERIQKAEDRKLIHSPAGTKLSRGLNRSGYGFEQAMRSRKRKNLPRSFGG